MMHMGIYGSYAYGSELSPYGSYSAAPSLQRARSLGNIPVATAHKLASSRYSTVEPSAIYSLAGGYSTVESSAIYSQAGYGLPTGFNHSEWSPSPRLAPSPTPRSATTKAATPSAPSIFPPATSRSATPTNAPPSITTKATANNAPPSATTKATTKATPSAQPILPPATPRSATPTNAPPSVTTKATAKTTSTPILSPTKAPPSAPPPTPNNPHGYSRILVDRPSMLTDIARAKARVHRSVTNSKPSEDCCWVYAVQPKRDLSAGGEHRLQELADGDVHYAKQSYLVQRIALRFSHVLDPVLVAQAVRSALEEYPLAGSRLVKHEGGTYFHLKSAEINVHVVNVPPRLLRSGAASEWLHVCEEMVTPGGPKGCFVPVVDQFTLQNLCEFYLLVSADSTAGCVIIGGFQHVIGDATCYGLFLRAWSEKYEQGLERKLRELLQTGEASNGAEGGLDRRQFIQAHMHRLPEPVLPVGEFKVPLPKRVPKQSIRRLLRFSPKGLESLKAQVGIDTRFSTNDILIAQFACAIAPFRLGALRTSAGLPLSGSQQRGATIGGASKTTSSNGRTITKISAPHAASTSSSDPINTTATILMMADQRGRGVKKEAWGNYAEFMFIEISFKLLMSGNIAAVAHAIHTALRYELHKLEFDSVLYEIDKKRLDTKPKLFIWNSWARIGHSVRNACFGGAPESLLEVEYLNQQLLEANEGTIVSVSPFHTNGLQVGITTASRTGTAEMDKLEGKYWTQSTRLGTADVAGTNGECSADGDKERKGADEAVFFGDISPTKTGKGTERARMEPNPRPLDGVAHGVALQTVKVN